ncbi:hypothetical protein [Marinicellulosiphila megalodicopiae]|uniref:hypothetical protein n=1 Tax=Marinicellulosiphila megalodicopiae TaxID=2724896 RepID=UPI003BAF0AB5
MSLRNQIKQKRSELNNRRMITVKEWGTPANPARIYYPAISLKIKQQAYKLAEHYVRMEDKTAVITAGHLVIAQIITLCEDENGEKLFSKGEFNDMCNDDALIYERINSMIESRLDFSELVEEKKPV